MSVILDIDMPKTARDCIFNQPAPFRGDFCIINNVCTFPDGCPLHEIKPHGRLIDADALMKSISPYMNWTNVLWEIAQAPTIIEAESSESRVTGCE